MIEYKKGYKYQLQHDYVHPIDLPRGLSMASDFFGLFQGVLTIRKGYAWDGPSGPTIHTPSFMRGSLVHDVLYQAFDEQLLNRERWRKFADEELRRICIEDGMARLRAEYVYRAVRIFGRYWGDLTDSQRVFRAP